MNKETIRIIYMGTPEFAVEPLKKLVENNYNVVAVVTMPDKPAGRGHKIQHSAVKEYALSKDLPILQPTNLKDEEFIAELASYKADLQIVVAFRMLPEVVWDMPKMGTFNLHGSLLPQYRGAAPINWAIINGEAQTGVTTFLLQHEIDTGHILLQRKVEIGPNDNVGDIHDKLMFLGANTVVDTVDLILSGQENPIPQTELIQAEKMNLKAAPKIFKETCQINWNQSAQAVHNFIRGLSPYPAAWSTLLDAEGEKRVVKIFQSRIVDRQHQLAMGSILQEEKDELLVAVQDGFIAIEMMQLPGKKRLPIGDLLRGFAIDSSFSML